MDGVVTFSDFLAPKSYSLKVDSRSFGLPPLYSRNLIEHWAIHFTCELIHWMQLITIAALPMIMVHLFYDFSLIARFLNVLDLY